MKRILTTAILAAGVLMFAGSAMAATKTANVAVSSTITGTCSAITAPATVAFTLDPSVGGLVTVANNVTFRCTNTTAYTLTNNLGLNSGSCGGVNCMNDGGTNYINYGIALGATATGSGTGMAPAQTKTVTMDATVAEADYINATPGAYSDTLVLTLTY